MSRWRENAAMPKKVTRDAGGARTTALRLSRTGRLDFRGATANASTERCRTARRSTPRTYAGAPNRGRAQEPTPHRQHAPRVAWGAFGRLRGPETRQLAAAPRTEAASSVSDFGLPTHPSRTRAPRPGSYTDDAADNQSIRDHEALSAYSVIGPGGTMLFRGSKRTQATPSQRRLPGHCRQSMETSRLAPSRGGRGRAEQAGTGGDSSLSAAHG